ncbi:MAG: hypothetical protein V1873_03385 [Verrucomicrobiota bacterium]
MKTTAMAVLLLVLVSGLAGCATPAERVGELRLGDTPDDVLHKMGSPFTIRAAKIYENSETAEVWEYMPPILSWAILLDRYDKDYWVIFENGKVVQWGEPGDFSGQSSISGDVPVNDYFNKKLLR